MIIFPMLRTRRVAVKLRELTLGEAISLLKLPANRPEQAISEFLGFAAAGASAPSVQHVTDPRLWTVEERTRVVCHYMSHVSEEGLDFSVGDSGAALSTYVALDEDVSTLIHDAGQVAGRQVNVHHLLGAHAEVLERVCAGYGDWLIGMMACQCTEGERLAIEDMPELDAINTVTARMDALRAMPESDFEGLLRAYESGCRALRHFFVRGHKDDGLVWLAREEVGGSEMPPARFPATANVGEAARALAG